MCVNSKLSCTFVPEKKKAGRMQRIFLIGYMGAGKTTVGKELSKKSGLSFIDLDHFLEGRYHKTVRQIFEAKGEDGFRQAERRALHEVSDFENVIISTGGGTPCFFDNMEYMNTLGTTVYLKVSTPRLTERIALCKQTRPVLKDLSEDKLMDFVEASLMERSRFYEQAQIIFDAEIMETEKDVNVLVSKLQKTITDFYS